MWFLDENNDQVEEDEYRTAVSRDRRRDEYHGLAEHDQQHSQVHGIAGETVQAVRYQAGRLLADEKPQMPREKDGGRPSGGEESDQANAIYHCPRRNQ